MEELVAEGAVIVTTSNRPPWELQDHGLHEVRSGALSPRRQNALPLVISFADLNRG